MLAGTFVATTADQVVYSSTTDGIVAAALVKNFNASSNNLLVIVDPVTGNSYAHLEPGDSMPANHRGIGGITSIIVKTLSGTATGMISTIKR